MNASFYTTARHLGILKHQTQRVYRLAYDTKLLKTHIETTQTQLNQVQTVLRVQKEYLEEIKAVSTTPAPPDAVRFVQLYYDIARREEEVERLIRDLYEAKKNYAFHIHEIQESHTDILKRIQDTKDTLTDWPKEINFDASYKAIQHTIPLQTNIRVSHDTNV